MTVVYQVCKGLAFGWSHVWFPHGSKSRLFCIVKKRSTLFIRCGCGTHPIFTIFQIVC